MITNGIIFAILLGVIFLGYIVRAGLIVMLAGFGMLIFGFSLWTLYWWLSLIVAGVGAVIIWQGAKA